MTIRKKVKHKKSVLYDVSYLYNEYQPDTIEIVDRISKGHLTLNSARQCIKDVKNKAGKKAHGFRIIKNTEEIYYEENSCKECEYKENIDKNHDYPCFKCYTSDKSNSN